MDRGKSLFLAGIFVLYAVGTFAFVMYLSQHRPTASSLGLLSGNTQLPDMRAIRDIPTRKQTFIDTLTPLIEQKNGQLSSLRQTLQQWQQQLEQGELANQDMVLLKRLEKRYRLTEQQEKSVANRVRALLRRLDTIPTSLVLAQAAAESGWGTSRFARQANNLFGQWCYRKGCGLVPKRRSRGARHEVQKFAALEPAIDAYFRNLNTHQAYTELRSERLAYHQQNKSVSGIQLAEHLTSYSSRGQPYVEEIKELIRYNRLTRFD
ncbi:glucosaminidase domain-containing protein [Gilvimarinus sp. SDUM040013]|uniref:Glucosaminidase domain-containing protein n=1 Tax=Gilvimarinus gilvus TaxID=3058038 RepID=A0ABU4RYV7_9GAMM|nr:glucosaminidase domain-containing protein [Gilvimarinus sp. SDUM040013]MDO3387367.1 glucosaminidase domain-containing protein [Gilvimarinus sp. SDUM040013]MDX6849844.1 glucosaminidase domain-containing protein [Gilvimarinus sp. SDUM040013]